MNCDGARGLLSAYVDGELSAGELLRVEQHLRRCHWCADEVDALRQTIALVASLEEVEVPAAFHLQLHNRLVALGPPVQAGRTATAHRTRRQDFRRWAVPAAAAAALVIGAAGLNRLPPMPLNPPQIGERIPGQPAESARGKLSGQTANNDPVGTGTDDPRGNVNTVQNPSGEGTKTDPATTGTTGNPESSANGNTTHTTTSTGFGPTSDKPGAHTASFLDRISEPSSYARVMQPRAAVEAAVAEPATLAEELKRQFAGATVRQTTDELSGIHRLLIILPASEFKSGLSFLESELGLQAVDQSLPLDLEQMDELWASLTRLDEDRKLLEARKTTDPLVQKDLAELQEQANKAREAYHNLVAMSESGTISVTLKPMKGQ